MFDIIVLCDSKVFKAIYSKQIQGLKEQFEVYIKTVIDVGRKICVAGMDRHFEGEQILLKEGSAQKISGEEGLTWKLWKLTTIPL